MTDLPTLLLCASLAALQPAPVPPAADQPFAPQLLSAVPRDALAAVFVKPAAPGAEPGKLQALTSLAHHLRAMGLLGSDGALLWLDALRVVPFSRSWPAAWVLHDVRLESFGNGSNRLGGLGASLVLYDGGDHQAVADQIRHFLRSYTTDRTTRLESWDLQGRTFYRLIDERLPAWAVFEWGPAGEVYVVSVGRGASERVIAALAGAGRDLHSEAFFTMAWAALQAEGAGGCVYLDGAALRQALGEGGGRVQAVAQALGLQRTTHSMWTVRRGGRAILLEGMQRGAEGRDQRIVISRPPGELADRVPPQATWHMVIAQPPAKIVLWVRDIYLAWHRPETQQRLQAGWAALEREKVVDLQRDVLAHLGNHVIVHNAPPHPLGLPGMVTLLVAIDGEAAALRSSLDKIFEHLALRLDAAALRGGAFAPRLIEAEDGVWYTQAGLYGPALAVTDDYVVISYSLAALRHNLQPTLPAPEPTPPAE